MKEITSYNRAVQYLNKVFKLINAEFFNDALDMLFFAEAKCRLLQNVMYVDCCKQTLGATPPNPCKINGCGKLEPTFTTSVDSAITYKWVLQFSVFYFCNKQYANNYSTINGRSIWTYHSEQNLDE